MRRSQWSLLCLVACLVLLLAAPAHSARPGEIWTDPATGMEFVWVPQGCFQMGSTSGEADEKPVHEVCVDGFWLGKTEVTQGQWTRVMGSNPSRFKKGDDYPVEQVSWNDVQEYIGKLNEQGNGKFRLPAEAEWEYAARSGGRDETYAGGEDVERVAWHNGNSGRSTHRVGTKAPNGLGLYDMSGNVWEWVQDWYAEDAYASHSKSNPISNNSASGNRVLRGGCWNFNPVHTRAAERDKSTPDNRLRCVGFRLVRLPQD